MATKRNDVVKAPKELLDIIKAHKEAVRQAEIAYNKQDRIESTMYRITERVCNEIVKAWKVANPLPKNAKLGDIFKSVANADTDWHGTTMKLHFQYLVFNGKKWVTGAGMQYFFTRDDARDYARQLKDTASDKGTLKVKLPNGSEITLKKGQYEIK